MFIPSAVPETGTVMPNVHTGSLRHHRYRSTKGPPSWLHEPPCQNPGCPDKSHAPGKERTPACTGTPSRGAPAGGRNRYAAGPAIPDESHDIPSDEGPIGPEDARPIIHLNSETQNNPIMLFIGEFGNRYDLNAPYQRGAVWTVRQRQKMIETLVGGFPVPALIIAERPLRDNGGFSYRVVDGKQRMETLQQFTDGKFQIPHGWVSNFDVKPEHAAEVERTGMVTYLQMDEEFQNWFGMQTIGTVRFNPNKSYNESDRKWTDLSGEEALAQEVEMYMRYNTGGTAHTAEELERSAQVR